jgi:hypothetical protein
MIKLKIISSLDTFIIEILEQKKINQYLLIVKKQKEDKFIVEEETTSDYNKVVDILKYVKRIYNLEASKVEYEPSRLINKSDIEEIFLISENNIKVML